MRCRTIGTGHFGMLVGGFIVGSEFNIHTVDGQASFNSEPNIQKNGRVGFHKVINVRMGDVRVNFGHES